jgi:hypothetical protein
MIEMRLADNPACGRSRWGLLALLVVPLFLWAGCQNRPADREAEAGMEADKGKKADKGKETDREQH